MRRVGGRCRTGGRRRRDSQSAPPHLRLADSKIPARRGRERLAPIIRERSIGLGSAWSDRAEIDSLNIPGCYLSRHAPRVVAFASLPTHVQVDGNQLPRIEDLRLGCTVEAIMGRCPASPPSALPPSLQKLPGRDDGEARYLLPGFDLAPQGYGTPAHLEALHARSFAPAPQILQPSQLAFGSKVRWMLSSLTCGAH